MIWKKIIINLNDENIEEKKKKQALGKNLQKKKKKKDAGYKITSWKLFEQCNLG